MKIKICCFVGHRNIEITDKIEKEIYDFIEHLIRFENVQIFLFGSKSRFNEICYDIVSVLKEKYFDIKRVYVRAQYEFLSKRYENYLLEGFEETFYPKDCKNSGRLSYIKRNFSMIDQSDFCLFYFNSGYLPPQKRVSQKYLFAFQSKSGTAIAYKYARQKKKRIHNFFEKSSDKIKKF